MQVKIDAIPEPITYAKIVSHYIKKCRPTQQHECKWFGQKQTFRKSLSLIASAQLSIDGVLTRKADHQRRLINANLDKAETRLLEAEKELRKAKSFSEIHQAVTDALLYATGLGPMYAYDTALRIAALKGEGSLPAEVYLIAGAKDGAKEIFDRPPAIMQVAEPIAITKPMASVISIISPKARQSLCATRRFWNTTYSSTGHRVAASGACMNGSTSLHLTMFGLNPVVRFGSDRLKDAFLPRAAAGHINALVAVFIHQRHRADRGQPPLLVGVADPGPLMGLGSGDGRAADDRLGTADRSASRPRGGDEVDTDR